MNANSRKLEAITALPSVERYKHFIKVAADQQQVWGLYSDGWAMAATESGERAFPLWPGKEYAELCAIKEWSGFVPRSIPISALLTELLPKLRVDHVLPAVFPSPASSGITPSIEEFVGALNSELDHY